MVSRKLSAGMDGAAALCGRAFADDPLYRAAEPEAHARERLARAVARLYCSYCGRYGRVLMRGDNPDGLMLLLPPEEYDLTLPRMIRSGALRLLYDAPLRPLVRISAVEAVADAAHARDTAGPHWYLLMLAVEPSLQGRGIGSSLLRPFLDERDAASEDVYLDTHNDANVALYERLGFKLKSSTPIPGLPGVLHHSMLRAPR